MKRIAVATLLLVSCLACEPPVPPGRGCSDDTDCSADQRCDLNSALCVPLDSGQRVDAAPVDAQELDAGALTDRATADHGARDGADLDAALAEHSASDSREADGHVQDGGGDSGPGLDTSSSMDTGSGLDTSPGVDGTLGHHANAGPDQQVPRNTRVYLSAAGSVLPQGASIEYAWTLDVAPANSGAILIDTDQSTCSFVAGDAHGHYEVALEITVDGTPLPADRVVVDVLNTVPVASAGSDLGVYQGGSVALDGSASYDDDGDDLTFTWEIVQGSGGSFDDSGSATPTLTPDSGFTGSLTLRLTVDDGHGGVHSDEVDVVVSANLPPHIDPLVDLTVPHSCGGTPLRCGAQADLNATVTEPEGEGYTVLWELVGCPGGDAVAGACPDQGPIAGPVPSFGDPALASTTLALDEDPGVRIAGLYTLRITATDAGGRSATASVHVTVQNQQPVGQGSTASAPHSYAGGIYVCQVEFTYALDDDDGDPLQVAYLVSPQAGFVTPGPTNTATFGVSGATPSPGLLGPYTITVTATDGQGGSTQFIQTVSCTNSAPSVGSITDATPAGHFYRSTGSVYGSNVALSASVDDVEDDPVTCTWSVPAPVSAVSYGNMPQALSPIVVLPGTAALTREISSTAGTQVIAEHGFRLSCSDGFGSDLRDVNVTVTNRTPSTSAGADMSTNHSYIVGTNPYRASAALGSRGSGNASATDPDGDPLVYSWTQTSATTGNNPTASATTSLSPTYSWSGDTRVVATHTLRLTVTDGPGAVAQDSMNVVVGNRAPVASAGEDMSAHHAYVSAATRYDVGFDLNTRTTKATATDPDGDPLTMAWSPVTTPAGVTYLYSNPAHSNPVVTAQGTTAVVGNHDLRFTVTDPFTSSSSDTVRLTGLNRAPVVSVAASISPSPLNVSLTCLQFNPPGPDTPTSCVAAISALAPQSTYATTFVDPDADPITAIVTPTINNNNGVRIVGHSQTGTSITVSSGSGAPLAISADVQLTSRTFQDPCTGFNMSGYFVGLVPGKPAGNITEVDVGAVVNDPFTQITTSVTTSVSASNRVDCN
ncbi:MAG: cadherin-like domain-containing protein [Pseudomonadota bacterium]